MIDITENVLKLSPVKRALVIGSITLINIMWPFMQIAMFVKLIFIL